MIAAPEGFSHSYASARRRFYEAAQAAQLDVEAFKYRLPGRDNEVLAIDVCLDGQADAQRLLVISSGVHGVEGYCGSGIQVFALHDENLRQAARANGVALLYIHAVNPYGFSYIRRVTHENVDLNRNFQDFSKPLPVNLGYRDLHDLLLPKQLPPNLTNKAQVAWRMLTQDKRAFQAAVSAGQHQFADGLFYGGVEPTWSNQTLRRIVQQYCQQALRIHWIDLHTGLGPQGHGERILAAHNNAEGLRDAKRIWGDQVTSFFDGSTVSAHVTGTMLDAMPAECPQAELHAIALEYGTHPVQTVMQAMRAEQWLQRNPKADPVFASRIKRQLLDAFFVNTDTWKQQVVDQARQAMLESVSSLSQN